MRKGDPDNDGEARLAKLTAFQTYIKRGLGKVEAARAAQTLSDGFRRRD